MMTKTFLQDEEHLKVNKQSKSDGHQCFVFVTGQAGCHQYFVYDRIIWVSSMLCVYDMITWMSPVLCVYYKTTWMSLVFCVCQNYLDVISISSDVTNRHSLCL